MLTVFYYDGSIDADGYYFSVDTIGAPLLGWYVIEDGEYVSGPFDTETEARHEMEAA